MQKHISFDSFCRTCKLSKVKTNEFLRSLARFPETGLYGTRRKSANLFRSYDFMSMLKSPPTKNISSKSQFKKINDSVKNFAVEICWGIFLSGNKITIWFKAIDSESIPFETKHFGHLKYVWAEWIYWPSAAQPIIPLASFKNVALCFHQLVAFFKWANPGLFSFIFLFLTKWNQTRIGLTRVGRSIHKTNTTAPAGSILKRSKYIKLAKTTFLKSGISAAI